MDTFKYDLPPFEFCKGYLMSSLSCYTIPPKSKDIFHGGLNMINDTVKSIEETEKPHAEFNYGIIEQGLNILIQLTLEKKHEKFFDKFIYDYTFLAHNINMNTLKNEVVINKCQLLERFSVKKETFTDTLVMFGSISEKLSQWKKFVPPSFKLSDHYFSVIKEE